MLVVKPKAATPAAAIKDGTYKASLTTRSYLTSHTMKAYSGIPSDSLEVTDLVSALKKAGDEVVGGDLGRIERTLTSQFLTLDTIFASLAERSKRQEYMKQMEVYLRLALKAQAQARATAEALAMLKNPQPYIRQANIAQGHQQVNNSYASASGHMNEEAIEDNRSPNFSGQHSGAGNFETVPSRLLEDEQ